MDLPIHFRRRPRPARGRVVEDLDGFADVLHVHAPRPVRARRLGGVVCVDALRLAEYPDGLGREGSLLELLGIARAGGGWI